MTSPARKSLFNKSNGSNQGQGNKPETFAFTVVKYDLESKLHAVIGTRIPTGEEVRVTLRDLDGPSGPNARAEIADFAAERTNILQPGTVEGGIMLAQEAFHNADGTHAARWIQVLSHHPGEAEVFNATITVSPVMTGQPKGNTKAKQSAYMQFVHDGDFDGCSDVLKEMLKITPPFKVDSVTELEEAITDLLADDIGVGVRLSNAEGFDGSYVKIDRKKFREFATDPERHEFAAAAAKEYIASIAEMVEPINSGLFTCEVISYSTIWAGSKTAQAMASRGNMQQRVNRFQDYVERTGNDKDGNPKEPLRYSLYRPAIVAIRQTPPDSVSGKTHAYFSHFEPLNTKPAVRGLIDAITYATSDVFAPEIPRPNNSQNTNAPAANSGNQGRSGGDAEKPGSAAGGDAAGQAQAGSEGPASDFEFNAGSDDDLLFEARFQEAGGSSDIGMDVPDPSAPAASASGAAAQADAPAPTRRYAGRRAAA